MTASPKCETFGQNQLGNALLCYAWGESERPCVAFVRTHVELRAWIIEEATGEESDELTRIVEELSEHDWRDGEMEVRYEIGGLRFEDVCTAPVRIPEEP